MSNEIGRTFKKQECEFTVCIKAFEYHRTVACATEVLPRAFPEDS